MVKWAYIIMQVLLLMNSVIMQVRLFEIQGDLWLKEEAQITVFLYLCVV